MQINKSTNQQLAFRGKFSVLEDVEKKLTKSNIRQLQELFKDVGSETDEFKVCVNKSYVRKEGNSHAGANYTVQPIYVDMIINNIPVTQNLTHEVMHGSGKAIIKPLEVLKNWGNSLIEFANKNKS